MNFKEWALKWFEENWNIVLLFVLLLMLSASHMFMIHYNRPHENISWIEGMITGVFTAIVAKLK